MAASNPLAERAFICNLDHHWCVGRAPRAWGPGSLRLALGSPSLPASVLPRASSLSPTCRRASQVHDRQDRRQLVRRGPPGRRPRRPAASAQQGAPFSLGRPSPRPCLHPFSPQVELQLPQPRPRVCQRHLPRCLPPPAQDGGECVCVYGVARPNRQPAFVSRLSHSSASRLRPVRRDTPSSSSAAPGSGRRT